MSQNFRKKIFYLFPVFFLSLFVSCASNHSLVSVDSYATRAQNLYIPEKSQINWQKIEHCSFAQYFFYENKNYPVRYHCVKINLSEPNLEIVTFPESKNDFSQKNGISQEYFTGITAKEFSEKYNSIVTINTAPFSGKKGSSSAITKITSTRTICGIHVANKTELSPANPYYSALCFIKEENGFSGKIVKRQTIDFSEYDFAFGGFFTILSNFQKEDFSWVSNDSRTAVGLSEDGKTLFILVVEGEKWSQSHGLSYPECADIFLALGAANAMQMDGGGSSSLFINQKNALTYSSLRKNAVFLGFRLNQH